jgi:hypothetical protein
MDVFKSSLIPRLKKKFFFSFHHHRRIESKISLAKKKVNSTMMMAFSIYQAGLLSLLYVLMNVAQVKEWIGKITPESFGDNELMVLGLRGGIFAAVAYFASPYLAQSMKGLEALDQGQALFAVVLFVAVSHSQVLQRAETVVAGISDSNGLTQFGSVVMAGVLGAASVVISKYLQGSD